MRSAVQMGSSVREDVRVELAMGVGIVTLGTACQKMDSTQFATEAPAHSMHRVSGTGSYKLRCVSKGRIHIARNWSACSLDLWHFVLE